MEMKIYSIDGKEKGTAVLPPVFETKIIPVLLHEVVTGHLANQRAGTHSTKTRGDVSGGGAKPYKQKGTGGARRGTNRSPLTRGGGIIFGPHPHGYTQNISQQKRVQSLCMALSAKAQGGNVVLLDELTLAAPKTKHIASLIQSLKLKGSSILLVVDVLSDTLKRASRNYPLLAIEEARNLNAYQVMWANKLVLTTKALELVSHKGQ
ncbi:MAG: 50S ribosomal protein L4 [Elusimicrobia bacterium]|nr:50S ribosomal protein L4 [Elusimicrobiota bacterium]